MNVEKEDDFEITILNNLKPIRVYYGNSWWQYHLKKLAVFKTVMSKDKSHCFDQELDLTNLFETTAMHYFFRTRTVFLAGYNLCTYTHKIDNVGIGKSTSVSDSFGSHLH